MIMYPTYGLGSQSGLEKHTAPNYSAKQQVIGVPLEEKSGKFLPRSAISQHFQVILLTTPVEKEGNSYLWGDYCVPGAVLDALCVHFNP